MVMLGAIVGDVVGSRFEFRNRRNKKFDLFTTHCFFTDDTVMTLAIAKAVMDSKPDYSDLGEKAVQCMREVGQPYPTCGYGGKFRRWMYESNPQPYNSFGNGAAMRVSACGYAAGSLEEGKRMSKAVTEVTHNHPEGIKGAEATTVAIYMARTGSTMEEIREVIERDYYPMDFTLDGIRATYQFNETCQDTVPQALKAFFESTDFEDAIRNAVSVGGVSDTLAAITGSIAQAYYGVPYEIRAEALSRLDVRLYGIFAEFEKRFG